MSAWLLQPHHDAIGRALPVDHGEAYETGTLRCKEQRAAAWADLRQRHAIDQHSERSRATGYLERDRLRPPVIPARQFDARAVGREHDAQWRPLAGQTGG